MKVGSEIYCVKITVGMRGLLEEGLKIPRLRDTLYTIRSAEPAGDGSNRTWIRLVEIVNPLCPNVGGGLIECVYDLDAFREVDFTALAEEIEECLNRELVEK